MHTLKISEITRSDERNLIDLHQITATLHHSTVQAKIKFPPSKDNCERAANITVNNFPTNHTTSSLP